MFASALLAVSVAALASAFSASYAHDKAANTRIDSISAGEQLLEQSIALPVDASDELSIRAIDHFADDVVLESVEQLLPQTAPIVSVLGITAMLADDRDDDATPPAGLSVSRLVTVNEDDGSIAASLARNAPRELAWVRVTVTAPDGSTATVRRLVHRAEGR
jgi:hypothetical protein